jgi:hypothetical protein
MKPKVRNKPIRIIDVLGEAASLYSWITDYYNIIQNNRQSISEHRLITRDPSCVSAMKIYRSIVNSLIPKWEENDFAKTRKWKNYIENDWKSADFTTVTSAISDAFLWGYHPAQLIWKVDSENYRRITKIIPLKPEWFSFDIDETLVFHGAEETERISPRLVIIARNDYEYGNPYGLRESESLYYPVMFKKEAFKMMAVAAERFGIGGFIEGVMQNAKFYGDDDSVQEFANRLKSMVKDGMVVRPQDQEVKFNTYNGVVDGRLYESLIKLCNKEIAKVYLGHYLQLESEKGADATAEAISLGNKMIIETQTETIRNFWEQHRDQFFKENYTTSQEEFDKLKRDLPRLTLHPSDHTNIHLAQRDAYLVRIGFKPNKPYINKNYNIPLDDFDLIDIENNPQKQAESVQGIDNNAK